MLPDTTSLIRAVGASLCLFVIVTFSSVAFAQHTVGLTIYEPDSTYDGYTLFSPFPSDTTYLIDMWGRVVHAWDTDTPGGFNHAYLMEDGTLVKTQVGSGSTKISDPGEAGNVRKYDWDNVKLWDFTYQTDDYRAHHDIEPLSNGNVMMIAWENKTAAEWTAAGGNPASLDTTFVWPDHIIEVMPTGATTGDIVWEWHMWDHLIQDFDGSKSNFGVVGANPQRIDINGTGFEGADWAHINGIDYNPTLNQIVLSTPNYNEIWIVDRSTNTAQAATTSGGNSGMGGDLLYRWGNPRMYDQGTGADQKLFFQHDARWIAPGLPGADNILIFNNRNPGGAPGPAGDYSSVDEIVMPDSGSVYKKPRPTYLPDALEWTYVADPPESFIGRAVSGAQRLPNGNTLVCNGSLGRLFEVTPSGTVVWQYISPVTGTSGTVAQGTTVADFTNLLFKCDRYNYDFPAFAGKDLTPGGTIEPGTAQTAWLDSPADSAVSVGTTPTFMWQGASNATSYHLQVSTSPGFAPGDLVIDQAGIGGTSHAVTSKRAVALPEGVLYWRVQSEGAFGPGPMSDTRVFSTNEALLPVEMVAFRATPLEDGAVALIWATASETNNAGFEIEHREFGGVFESVAFVTGAGTTSEPQSYQFEIAGMEPGSHDFRIRQIDFDGGFEYHGPISLELEAPESVWISSPYPNPFNPTSRIRFTVSTPGEVTVAMYDMLGHEVATLYRGEPERGAFVEAVVDGSNLASGVYVIRLESTSGLTATRVALLAK